MLCAIHLFNLRARLVGVNQILSTYMQHLDRDETIFAHNLFM